MIAESHYSGYNQGTVNSHLSFERISLQIHRGCWQASHSFDCTANALACHRMPGQGSPAASSAECLLLQWRERISLMVFQSNRASLSGVILL